MSLRKTSSDGSQERIYFSVVVPTRERYDTLYYTLQTCLNQRYEPCEILVSDNWSQDETEAVVRSFQDSRLRYVNTGRRLSMTGNYEFALSQVSGSSTTSTSQHYVIFIGDDDALMPAALESLDKIIRETGWQAIKWSLGSYNWPDPSHQAVDANLLTVPLSGAVERRETHAAIREVIEGDFNWLRLPMIYHGAVCLDVIQRIQERTGDFFHSIVPDLYSGFAVASMLREYGFSQRPFSLGGTSHHSIGRAFTQADGKEKSEQFVKEIDRPNHPRLPFTRNAAIATAETFFQCQDRFETAQAIPLNVEHLLQVALRQASSAQPAHYNEMVEAIREAGRRNEVGEMAVERMISAHPNHPAVPSLPSLGYYRREALYIVDASDFDAYDVFSASLLAHTLYTLERLNYKTYSRQLRTMIHRLKSRLKRSFHRL